VRAIPQENFQDSLEEINYFLETQYELLSHWLSFYPRIS